MIIQRAISEQHLELTELTVASKSYWNYSKEQIADWRSDLTIIADYIRANEVYVLLINDEIAGYYSYLFLDSSKVLLDNLFILPIFIGKGLGSFLMQNFLERAKTEGASEVELYSDPNVEEFYATFDFLRVGKKETTIENRFLPVMWKKL